MVVQAKIPCTCRGPRALTGDRRPTAKRTDDKKQEKTSNIRKAADEFCSTMHLGQKLGNVNSGPLLIEIAGFLGLPGRDGSWVTTWGEDVTYLCDQSDSGGFHGHHWTMAGWVLDNVSIEALLQEFQNSLHT